MSGGGSPVEIIAVSSQLPGVIVNRLEAELRTFDPNVKLFWSTERARHLSIGPFENGTRVFVQGGISAKGIAIARQYLSRYGDVKFGSGTMHGLNGSNGHVSYVPDFDDTVADVIPPEHSPYRMADGTVLR